MSEEYSVSHQLPAGTVLNGRYEIIRLLGEGGFGITYLGHNNVLDIPVAIKEYYPKGYANRMVTQNLTVTITDKTQNAYFDKWKTKFLTEARMLAKFANLPGIVNVYDFFEQHGTAYIIMEHLDGITLKTYVEKNGPMNPGTFLKRLIPVLKSLEKIHQQGLIHRDISPDNLMLMEDGYLKLYDFGAAREYSDATQSTFSVIIKPCFAPEEQYRSKGIQGPWTDVYSICATIYYSITGVVPDDALQRVFSDELKKPSELGVNIPPEIEAVILKGMSVRSNDRFDSVAPLISAFERMSANITDIADFRKEKKPKTNKISKLFSKLHSFTKSQESVSVTQREQPPMPPTHSRPVTTSATEKTEIVFTQFEPSATHTDLYVENEIKRRSKSEPEISNHFADQGNIHIVDNEAKAILGNIDKPTQDKQDENANTTGIFCPKCRGLLPVYAKFCGFCGIKLIVGEPAQGVLESPVPPKRPAANSSVIRCPKCKAFLPNTAKFCGVCGISLLSFKSTRQK